MVGDWEEESARSDFGLEAAEKLARQSFHLIRVYAPNKREAQAWCDREKEIGLEKAEADLLEIFGRLQSQAAEKLEEEQSRLDETKVLRLRKEHQEREAARSSLEMGSLGA
jgi:hypothetical protein